MRTLRSLLRNRRKSVSERAPRNGSKQWIEGLESRMLLSAAVAHALATPSSPVVHSASITPFVGMTPSMTSLGVTPGNIIAAGTSVTLSAIVSGGSGTPTGTVTFFDDTGTGPVAISGAIMLDMTGAASFVTSSLPVGATNNITAVYSGDPVIYAGSTSAATNVTVDSVTVTAPTPSAFGASVTLTATVDPIGTTPFPTGTVTFFDGAAQLDAMPIALSGSGTATYTTSSLPGGPNNITAVYSGDTNFANATSPNFVETINGAPSSISVSSATPMSNFGTTVTFTATVPQGGATGSVIFYSNGTAISGMVALNSGSAMFTTTLAAPLAAGVDQITAVYSGDSTYSGSTSGNYTETVAPANTTTTLSVAPGNNVSVGTGLVFTATVAPVTMGLPAPTGTVTFYDNPVSGPPVALGAPVMLIAGTATSPSISSLAVGMHNITAVYTPAADYNTSTSTPLAETITQGMATATVSSMSPSAPLNTPLMFTATVAGAGPTPTGTVTLLDGMTAIAGPGTLVGGTFVFPIANLAVGLHSLTISYSGDTNYLPTVSAVFPQDITLGATTSTVTINPAGSSTFMSSVIITANVTSTILPIPMGNPSPTGTVTFYDGATLIGGPLLINAMGGAAISTNALPVGADMITVVYSGDTNYAGSTSAPVTQNVGVASASVVLTTTPVQSTIALGGSITLNAIVIPNINGTVTFFDNGVALGLPVTLVGSMASLTYTAPSLGAHDLTVTFNGNANYGTATSNTITETVVPTSSVTSLTASVLPAIAVGASETFTATVTPPPSTSGLPTPTGTVTFTEDGTTVLGIVTLDVNGMASLTTTALTLGSDAITATYNGDSNFGGSISNTVTVAVVPITSNTTTTTLTSNATTVAAGTSVDFTAIVAPTLGVGITPTGTVTFYDGTQQMSAPVTLNSSGVATLTSTLPTGNDNIMAVYSGVGGGYSSSASAPLTEIVGIGTTAATFYNTNLGVTSTSVPFDTPVTITATVSPTVSGGPSPVGGTVTFANGNTILNTFSVQTDDTATFTVMLPPGTNNITGTYSGGAALSTSAPMAITVASSVIPNLGLTVLPSNATAGGSFSVKLPIVLTNHGAKLNGKFTFNIYADTSSTLDVNKVLIKTMTVHGSLTTGQAKTFNVNLKSLPISLAGGDYYIVAQMTDPVGGQNAAASPTTVTVAAAVITPDATVGAVTPGILKVGTVASLILTLTNDGNVTANGPLTITLSPSADGATPVAGATFAGLSLKSISMPVGKPHTFRLHFKVTAAMVAALTAGDMYFPLLSISLAGTSATAVGTTEFTFS